MHPNIYIFMVFSKGIEFTEIYYSVIITFYEAGLAQSVERGTFNPEVKGSSPFFVEV